MANSYRLNFIQPDLPMANQNNKTYIDSTFKNL